MLFSLTTSQLDSSSLLQRPRIAYHGQDPIDMVLSAPTRKSSTPISALSTSPDTSVFGSPGSNVRQPYRRGSKGGLQTPAVEQDLALPERVLENILEHVAQGSCEASRSARSTQDAPSQRPRVSRESSQPLSDAASNQAFLLGILSLSKTTKVSQSIYRFHLNGLADKKSRRNTTPGHGRTSPLPPPLHPPRRFPPPTHRISPARRIPLGFAQEHALLYPRTIHYHPRPEEDRLWYCPDGSITSPIDLLLVLDHVIPFTS